MCHCIYSVFAHSDKIHNNRLVKETNIKNIKETQHKKKYW